MTVRDSDIRAAIRTLQQILETRKRGRNLRRVDREEFLMDEVARNGGRMPGWAKLRTWK